MWSDPDEVESWAVSPRGAGWLFGAKVTSEVCPAYHRFRPSTVNELIFSLHMLQPSILEYTISSTTSTTSR